MVCTIIVICDANSDAYNDTWMVWEWMIVMNGDRGGCDADRQMVTRVDDVEMIMMDDGCVDVFQKLTSSLGTTVNVPLNTKRLVITKLKIDNSRKRILDRKAKTRGKKEDKGKITQQEVSMAQVD